MKPFDSLQQVFDVAYRGMAAQDWAKSTSITFGCEYRIPETENHGELRCAIGHCIPDELIYEASGRIGYLMFRKREFAELFKNIGGSTMNELQECHDKAEDEAEMRARFATFAFEHELTIPDDVH